MVLVRTSLNMATRTMFKGKERGNKRKKEFTFLSVSAYHPQ